MIKKFIYFIIGCLLLLLGVMIWNMKEFTSRQIEVSTINKILIDNDKSIKHLSEAITYKTISNNNKTILTYLILLYLFEI